LNAPFRGGKSTPLEGGVHVPALAVDFSQDNRYLGEGNRTYNGIAHVTDWFPTLLSVAQGNVSRFIQSGGDGIDMSAALRGNGGARSEHRKETLLELYSSDEFIYKESMAAYLSGDMKLVEGHIRDPNWYSALFGQLI
jgi:arylsulfatase A-like enzyme